MRYEEKRIYQFLKESGFIIDVLLESADLDEIVEHSSKYAIAVIRILSQHKAIKTAEYLELLGIRTINSSSAIRICADKAEQALRFSSVKDVDQPEFSILRKYESLNDEFQQLGHNVVVKPVSASWGRGISHITDDQSLAVWQETHRELDIKNEKLPYLVQKFVNKPNYDIRVVIVGDRAIVAFERYSPDNWKTNTHLGASVVPMPISTDMQKVVSAVIAVIGTGIYGLDLMQDESGNLLFCEINQNPEFAQSWKIHNVDVGKLIAQFVVAEARKELNYSEAN